MMNSVYISVVIPSFRPKEYILECLNCLKRQTLSNDLFEVIIVLNGEKEPYYEELKKYIKGILNFRILYVPTAGVSRARNIGIENLCGSHVIFIDDDDFISLNFLSEIHEKIVDRPNDIIVSNFLRYYSQDRIENDYMTKSYEVLLSKKGSFSLLDNRKILSSSCGKAIPLKLVKNIRFNESVRISEDALFMFELSKNITKITYLPLFVTYYRSVRELSASRKKMALKVRFILLLTSYMNFSKVYFRDPTNYNFIFYLNRIMAVTKYFFKNLI